MRQLAVVRSYSDLVKTLRARRDELNVPHEIIDEIAGLAAGHTSKLLCPEPMKLIGPVSWNIFEALGLRLVCVEDLTALARAMHNHQWRTRRQSHKLAACSYPQALGQITPENAVKMARKRASALSPARRTAIARKAGKARWKKPQILPQHRPQD